ncbi:hypothetical protein N7530_005993 [Penicillium desertorum]|uniref:Uncharacterized protein n=1 Tax=Penicillium desertorum TaxID=1303715 RepID=A0A9X0BRW9_9EURO|nr:hypothetical protein N7530_005993 [Penicillium desertorum]
MLNENSANVINGRESNKSLMRAIIWIKYIEATRRIRKQAEECKCDPSVAIQSRLEKLIRETSNTFGRLERALRQKAIIDIERQLSGAAVDNEEAKKRRSGKEGTLLWLRSPDTIVSLKTSVLLELTKKSYSSPELS